MTVEIALLQLPRSLAEKQAEVRLAKKCTSCTVASKYSNSSTEREVKMRRELLRHHFFQSFH